MIRSLLDSSRGKLDAFRFRSFTREDIFGRSQYSLIDTLEGHDGCVNRISFSGDGTFLVSGSDDRCVKLWDIREITATGGHLANTIHTGHGANIFGVRILPLDSPNWIVSCAMDGNVKLSEAVTGRVLNSYDDVHGGERVKGVEVCQAEPNLFWSCGEDGKVQQYDFRMKDAPHNKNTIFHTRKELSAIDISKSLPHYMAIAGGDEYIRVIDRRFGGGPARDRGGGDSQCVVKFAPPHLLKSNNRHHRNLHSTHVEFDAKGNQLIANFHNDHVYVFNFIDSLDRPEPQVALDTTFLPKRATKYFKEGSVHGSVNRQVHNFTAALGEASNCPELLIRRSRATLDRGFVGDYYASIADIDQALQLRPSDTLADLALRTKINCYIKLKRFSKAWSTAAAYKVKFPGAGSDIEEEIRSAMGDDEDEGSAGGDGVGGDDEEGRDADDEYDEMEDEGGDDTDRERKVETPAPNNAPTVDTVGTLDAVRIHLKKESSDDGIDDNDAHFSLGGCSNRGAVIGTSDWISSPSKPHRRVNRIVTTNTRYVGAINRATDIKEATFLGDSGKYVAAGSDDGRVYVWESMSGRLVTFFDSDDDIVNCVKSHPSLPIIAASGIESNIKIWEPLEGEEEVEGWSDILEETVNKNCDPATENTGASYISHSQIINMIMQQAMRHGGDEDGGDGPAHLPPQCAQQ